VIIQCPRNRSRAEPADLPAGSIVDRAGRPEETGDDAEAHDERQDLDEDEVVGELGIPRLGAGVA